MLRYVVFLTLICTQVQQGQGILGTLMGLRQAVLWWGAAWGSEKSLRVQAHHDAFISARNFFTGQFSEEAED
jgi:hypothetical protein